MNKLHSEIGTPTNLKIGPIIKNITSYNEKLKEAFISVVEAAVGPRIDAAPAIQARILAPSLQP